MKKTAYINPEIEVTRFHHNFIFNILLYGANIKFVASSVACIYSRPCAKNCGRTLVFVLNIKDIGIQKEFEMPQNANAIWGTFSFRVHLVYHHPMTLLSF